MEAMLVADVGPWSLLAAKLEAVEDSADNVDRLREVNNSLSQCREYNIIPSEPKFLLGRPRQTLSDCETLSPFSSSLSITLPSTWQRSIDRRQFLLVPSETGDIVCQFTRRVATPASPDSISGFRPPRPPTCRRRP